MASKTKTVSTPGSKTEQFTCPECGRTFARAAALGAHRRQAHGVAGATTRAKSNPVSRRGRTRAAATKTAGTARRPNRSIGGRGSRAQAPTAAISRNTLLKTLFPQGIPPRDDVIHSVNSWLDEAERIASMR